MAQVRSSAGQAPGRKPWAGDQGARGVPQLAGTQRPQSSQGITLDDRPCSLTASLADATPLAASRHPNSRCQLPAGRAGPPEMHLWRLLADVARSTRATC